MKTFKIGVMFLICVLAVQVPVQAIEAIDWSSGPDLPEVRSDAAAILSPNNAVLVIGGENATNANTVPKLVANETVWASAPNIDTPRNAPGVVGSGENGILVIGGTGNGEASDEVLSYDYLFGDSQDVAKMTVARRQFAFASDNLGFSYAIGGIDDNGDALFDVEYFDPDGNIWRQIIDLPDARYSASAIGDDNGNVFVFGGVSMAGDIVDSVFCYSTIDNEWVILPPMLVSVRDSVAVFIEKSIYVTGGISDQGTVKTVQVYNLETGQWSLDTDLPEARSSHAAVIDSLGQMLVIGGYDNTGTSTATVYHSHLLLAPESLPYIFSSPVVSASLDRYYQYDVDAQGNPEPSYALVQAPEGMEIDYIGGNITWQPLGGQLGDHEVIVRASNRVGDTDQIFDINVVLDTFNPSSPTALKVDDIGVDFIDLSWNAATDAVGVDHYALFRQKRCGFRGRKTCFTPVTQQQNILQTQTKVTGLLPRSYHTFVVRAVDAAGNTSSNSNSVSGQTISVPDNFRYFFSGKADIPVISPAKTLIEIQLSSLANPKATYSIQSGPQGMIVDPVSGLVTWTPTVADIGTHAVVFQASNTAGTSTLNVSIIVSSDAPQLSVLFNPDTGGSSFAVAGIPFTAQINDASNTPPVYSLLNPPAGMTIDPVSGLINWLPASEQGGLTSVTVRSTSSAGTIDLIVEFYTFFTGSVSNIQVTDLTALNPLATWSAPIGTGANRVQGYTIVALAKYRRGRARLTDRIEYNLSGTAPQIELTGLTAGRNYAVTINAIDAAGNRGLVNPAPVSVVPRPALPSIGWKISNASDGSSIIAGQPMTVQLTDSNPASSGTLFEVVNGPAGFTIDPVTGTGNWTPGVGDIGLVAIQLRGTNTVGPRDITANVNVLFSGPVLNAQSFRVGQSSSASANWSAPNDNALPVASYRVTMHWRWGSRKRSRNMSTTSTSVNFSLTPTGAVWHRGVTITPIDALGRLGAPTPLIEYGTIAPPPPVNQAPTANAGQDQTITLPHNGVSLNGSGSDDGLPAIPGQLSYRWSVISGPGVVSFGNANLANTTASFSTDGPYLLRLSVSDSLLSSQDDVIVTINPAPQQVNQAPIANAGADQTITLPVNSVVLAGSAADDGLPAIPGVLNHQWQVVSGPGLVTFNNASAVNATANFSAEGVYILQFSSSDGVLSDVDNMTVTVNPEPVVIIPPPAPNTPPPYDKNGPELELKGTVDEIGDSYIKVAGYKVWFDSQTTIKFEDGSGASFQVGQKVEIKASENNDGTASAKKIQIGG